MKRRSFICLLILIFSSLNGHAQFDPAPSFFRLQRELPLVELNTTQTILVSDYGANINDGTNDIAGITAAINAAVNIATIDDPVHLVFESGTYDLMPDGSNSHSIEMVNANGILWDGQNAEFLIHNPTVGFLSLLRCKSTIIKDFSIDYSTLPFSQGVVTNVDAANGYFEFVVEDNFPLPTESLFMDAPERWGMIKNSKGGIKRGTPNLIFHNSYFQLIAPRTYKYGNQRSSDLSNVKVGDYFVHIARNNGKTLIRNTAGKNLTYLNVTGYASPAGGFNANGSEEWNVINCHIKLKEGRKHTINADVMHVNGGKIGPWVENCTFEGFADDCINIKHTKRVITAINSPTEITVKYNVDINASMEFYNPREGIFLGSAIVNYVENLGDNLFKLTLSNSINITNITNPDHQLADKAYVESRSNESFIFRNNIIRNSRRHGILLQSKYALIENNLFQNLSGAGLSIQNGVDWGEGFRANEIEIKNNRFENCGYDTDYIQENKSATIIVDFLKLASPCSVADAWCGTQTTNWQANRNIRILDNKILYNKRGVYLKNIDGLVLKNNFICHNDQDMALAENESAITQTILNSSNINVEDYNYDLPSANLQFKLNENSIDSDIINSGTNTDVALKITTQGGEITQGFFDDNIGYTLKVNTAGNGELKLVNSATQVPYPGPTGGSARTYSFWVKPAQAIFQTLMYSGGPLDGEVFSVQMQANGVLRVTDNNQNIVRMNDLPLDIGIWNHITISVPENDTFFSISLFKNGIPSNETYIGSDIVINTASNVVDFFPKFVGLASDIRYFDYNLCGGEIEKIYNDRQTTLSIDDQLQNDKNQINVFPTVTSDKIYFSKAIESIKVINLLGSTIIFKENSNFSELDISHLPSGLYLLKINNNQTAKIIKN